MSHPRMQTHASFSNGSRTTFGAWGGKARHGEIRWGFGASKKARDCFRTQNTRLLTGLNQKYRHEMDFDGAHWDGRTGVFGMCLGIFFGGVRTWFWGWSAAASGGMTSGRPFTFTCRGWLFGEALAGTCSVEYVVYVPLNLTRSTTGQAKGARKPDSRRALLFLA